jgi:hypothetical protein
MANSHRLEAKQKWTAATVLGIQDNVQTALSRPGLTKETLEEVIRMAREEEHKQWPVRSKTNVNDFKFNAQIHNPPERCVVRGLLDTGADESLISLQALERANIKGMKRMTNKHEFIGFDGKSVNAKGVITIEWYTNVTAIRKTRFFVLETLANDELDIIVGKQDIIRYNLLVAKSAVYALRTLNKSRKKPRTYYQVDMLTLRYRDS